MLEKPRQICETTWSIGTTILWGLQRRARVITPARDPHSVLKLPVVHVKWFEFSSNIIGGSKFHWNIEVCLLLKCHKILGYRIGLGVFGKVLLSVKLDPNFNSKVIVKQYKT